jgi:hypothetical protein
MTVIRIIATRPMKCPLTLQAVFRSEVWCSDGEGTFTVPDGPSLPPDPCNCDLRRFSASNAAGFSESCQPALKNTWRLTKGIEGSRIRLDRYAAGYENFVLVVGPHSGPARGVR